MHICYVSYVNCCTYVYVCTRDNRTIAQISYTSVALVICTLLIGYKVYLHNTDNGRMSHNHVLIHSHVSITAMVWSQPRSDHSYVLITAMIAAVICKIKQNYHWQSSLNWFRSTCDLWPPQIAMNTQSSSISISTVINCNDRNSPLQSNYWNPTCQFVKYPCRPNYCLGRDSFQFVNSLLV